MKETKSVVSVRLSDDRLEQLQALAELEASTLADEIRNAVDSFIDSKIGNKKELAKKIAEVNEKRESRLGKLLKA